MSRIEDRILNLAETHLGISDKAMLDMNVSEIGIKSMDAVNFIKMVNSEFDSNITGEDAAQLSSLRDLINHLES